MVNIVAMVGCSQGFGEALLRATLSNPDVLSEESGTVFILITRFKERAISLWNKAYFEERGKRFIDDSESKITVYVEEADLSQLRESHRLGELLTLMFQHIHSRIDTFYLFLNAGSVTPVGSMLDPITNDFENIISNHCVLNFMSYVLLLRVFLRIALGHKPSNSEMKVRLVNVSSLAATQGLYGMGVYGAIKAARESIMRTLSTELGTDFGCTDVRLLNYAPGPMDTELVREGLLSNDAGKNHVRDIVNLSYVDPRSSANKCISLLTSTEKLAAWSNGAHIDFFDEI